ncbi:hypothetical protein KT71_003157 [Congregibacter litoralis KT71]|uniref:Uncharacterized protein n=1 Tax=Congregibacter litoralis KT71 TaxID=314285 RepID=V7HSY8_9GAMM|nr:hypothetical protein KT71_003157 [Congregibacter litoralis KT71]
MKAVPTLRRELPSSFVSFFYICVSIRLDLKWKLFLNTRLDYIFN